MVVVFASFGCCMASLVNSLLTLFFRTMLPVKSKRCFLFGCSTSDAADACGAMAVVGEKFLPLE